MGQAEPPGSASPLSQLVRFGFLYPLFWARTFWEVTHEFYGLDALQITQPKLSKHRIQTTGPNHYWPQPHKITSSFLNQPLHMRQKKCWSFPISFSMSVPYVVNMEHVRNVCLRNWHCIPIWLQYSWKRWFSVLILLEILPDLLRAEPTPQTEPPRIVEPGLLQTGFPSCRQFHSTEGNVLAHIPVICQLASVIICLWMSRMNFSTWIRMTVVITADATEWLKAAIHYFC